MQGSEAKRRIEITEVGPRDGLQIEKTVVPTATKVEIINAMVEAGVRRIEATSFVAPRAVPQLADAEDVLAGIDRREDVFVTALCMNEKGAERAAKARLDAIVLVCSASDTHNRKNANRSVDESLAGFERVVEIARSAGLGVTGAIATSFGCPFEGDVSPDKLLHVAKAYEALGVTEIGLGDTTGMATPPLVREAVRGLREAIPAIDLTLHFHNTRGVGLANVLVGIDEGVTRYDSAIGGLGGCPFAAGATGNICTEDLVYLLEESGYETGIDLSRIVEVSRRMEQVIGRELPGQVMKAGPRLTLHRADDVATAAG